MRKLILLGSVFLSGLTFAQTSIQDARTNYAVGQTVTVRGVTTNGSEFGAIRYIQDATAGIGIYGNSFVNGVNRGDSILVTGQVAEFNGLLEVNPTTLTVVQAAPGPIIATPQIAPLSTVLADGESFEAELVTFENVTMVESGSFAASTNYHVTDGTNSLEFRVNPGTNLVGMAIPTGAISITGVLSQFNSIYQLLPRDQNDIVAYTPPSHEINVTIGGTTYLSGDEYSVGTTVSTSITIENLGVNALTISGASFTGANAGDFSSDITAGTIAGGSSQTYTVTYTAGGTGSRHATLNIASDDADENPYLIDLYAIGTDNLATEPTVGPTALVFNNLHAYTMNGVFVPAFDAEHYVVFWKEGSAITYVPVDGTTYDRGDHFGDAKVAYVGDANAFVPRQILANKDYYFAVYAFNGPEGFENYQTSASASNNVTTPGLNIGTYYNGINSNSTSFLQDLSGLVNPHTVVSYTNYKPTVMNVFEIKDTTDGQAYVTCAYSGQNEIIVEPFDWTTEGYSREHTFSHSWMPTYPADGQPALPEYSDQHNLYPTNLSGANTPRSNLPLGEVVGTPLYSYLDCQVGQNANGQLCFEPRDEHKGRAARAMMYMSVAYNGISGNTWQLPPNSSINDKVQDQEVLKNWHFQYPPDAYEIARQELIFFNQNNRNPFIDSAEFACHIDFSNMTYIENCTSLSVAQLDANQMSVYPVPATDFIYFQVNNTSITAYTIMDMQGRVISTANGTDSKVVKFDASSVAPGSYLIRVETPLGNTQQTVIVQ